jgi:predicted house-cleaning noncanonical NTP pyrophosphatase (MazG superfamily)
MGKLIRDKIPGFISADGELPVIRKLGHQEYVIELGKKAVEEARELEAAETNRDRIAELVDLQEVINALVLALALTPEFIDELRIKKVEERGAFADRIYWEGNE